MSRPNIIWVFADQMRGSAMSCASAINNAQQNVFTPNLDAMAGRGVRFSQACSTFPVCVPFRFTLLTGQPAISRLVPAIHYRLSPAERTIAHEFNDAGYSTCYFGKWHLYAAPMGGRNNGCVPTSHRGGFQEWHAFEPCGSTGDHFRTLIDDGHAEPRIVDHYNTDVYFELLSDWLRHPARRDQPFFTALSLQPPHSPYTATPDALARQAVRRLALSPNVPAPGTPHPDDPRRLFGYDDGRHDARLEEYTRHYYAMIEHIDEWMGRLFTTLQDTGLADNTYVMFFSDHGDMLGSHHRWHKSVPYEESINIPLIVHGPGIAAGEVYDLPTCTEDLMPTTLGLAGLMTGERLPGLDLSKYLRDPGQRPARSSVVCGQVNEIRQTQFTIMRMSWRLLRTRTHSFAALADQPWFLYDMQSDPYQLHNLIHEPGARTLVEQHCRELTSQLRAANDQFAFDLDRAINAPPTEPIWDIPVLMPQ